MDEIGVVSKKLEARFGQMAIVGRKKAERKDSAIGRHGEDIEISDVRKTILERARKGTAPFGECLMDEGRALFPERSLLLPQIMILKPMMLTLRSTS